MLTVSEMTSPKHASFGFGNYKMPTTDKYWKRPLLGQSSKGKLQTFSEVIGNQKAWVPGADEYQKAE